MPAPAAPARLTVVCPVYRDAVALDELRRRIRAQVANLPGIGALRFVVTDDTAGEDEALWAMRDTETQVLVPPYNLGHQGAIVFALRELTPSLAPDELVVTMDSDGEDRPEDLPTLLAPLLANPDDPFLVAVARRTRRQEALPFRISYLVYKALFKVLTGVVVRSGNFAAMRGALVVAAIGHPCFDQCYSASLISLPFRRHDVPIARGTRYSGRSRMGLFRLVTHGMHMLMPFLDRIAVRCLLLSSVVGAAAAAMLLAGAIAWWRGRGATAWAGGWTAGWAVTLLVAAAFGVLASLTLFSAAARARAQSVRVLHTEQPLAFRRPHVGREPEPDDGPR